MNYNRLLLIALTIGGIATAQMPGKDAPFVQAEKVAAGHDRIIRKSIGRTEAVRHVTVRAAVEGRLNEVLFQEGALVKEGDLLMRIDPLRYEAAVKQAEATLAQIEAQLVYANSRSNRFATLAAQQAASREDMETARAHMEELQAKKIGAEAELVRARKDLEDCCVYAEISGRIGRLPKGVGNYITRGEAITTITQMDPIYVRFPLSQNDVNGIFHGPKEISHVTDVQLITANGRQYENRGRIAIVDNQLTGSTDSYTLWAEFENPEHKLTHSGIGALTIELNNTREVCVVPLTAIHYDSDGAFVYTIDGQNVVTRRNVSTGPVQGRLQTIYQGLQVGEVVISDGSHKTRPGAKVRPVFADATRNEPGSAQGGELAPLKVGCAQVTEMADPTTLNIETARLEAVNVVELRPLVQGLVKEASFKEGERVNKGDCLFSIDPTRYQATVDASKAAIAQLDIKIADAQNKYDRQQKLMAVNAGSKDDMENARATLQELQSQLEAAKARLAVAQDDLQRCQVTAPISGRAGRVLISKGNYVTDINSPLVRVVQLSPIYARFPLSEKDILSVYGSAGKLAEQAELTLVTATGEELPDKGRVAFCDNEIQTGTGTQNVWAVFENTDHSLAPGGVVGIRVKRKADYPVLGIPQKAILTDSRGHYVYVIKHNRAVERRVLCGHSTDDGNVAIFAGLRPGEQVITTNLADMEENTPVQAQ